MDRIVLGLGSNIGNRLENLQKAVEYIEECGDIRVVDRSKIYETKAWGYTDQADFLNLCVEVETDVDEYSLLGRCQDIEKRLLRERLVRWGPRTIDVDILFFGDVLSKDEMLTIPHPRIADRAFVLVPLLDLKSKFFIEGKDMEYYLGLLDKNEIGQVKEFADERV
ncbi:MAG: 2-amino-4-hydroxy-6-hydroxymethyldihydropteridine diphosphokinase [Clostridioides sp.]|jgi:2-amino-4-hydroxy-6-hydroxymethyldihydropteridine diphosphokinase|nr:2-amino-4-hydroxy-6-hydroxymethyldihydropteridine diphosphokinase [Clostridioides sp.]